MTLRIIFQIIQQVYAIVTKSYMHINNIVFLFQH